MEESVRLEVEESGRYRPGWSLEESWGRQEEGNWRNHEGCMGESEESGGLELDDGFWRNQGAEEGKFEE